MRGGQLASERGSAGLDFNITHPSKKSSRMFKIAVDDHRVMEFAIFTIRTRREDDNLDKC